jgi:hypothetical protein
MNLYVKALAVPVLALGLACSTSGSAKKTASSGQGAGMSGSASTTTGGASANGQATAGVGSQDSTHQTMNEGMSGTAGTTGSTPGGVASELKGHASDKLISGRVAEVSADRLSITSDQGGNEDLQLVDQTVVQIDGRDAHASDLKQGQDVRASYNDVDGQRVAVKVEAAAPGSYGTGSGSTSGGSWGTGTGSTSDRTPPAEAKPGSTGSSADDSGRGGTTGASGTSNPNTEAPPGTPPSGKTGQTTKDPSKNY